MMCNEPKNNWCPGFGSLSVFLCLLLLLPCAYADSLNELKLDAEAVNADELEGEHGKSGLNLQFQVNDSQQNAVLTDNVLTNSVTGDNSISDNALSGASGITTVIQNTGNQVVLQANTMVNILINQ